MTKRQFMEELRSSLEGMVSQAVIQENMNYYEDYINEQIRNGKNEQDVLNELGSPRLIARSWRLIQSTSRSMSGPDWLISCVSSIFVSFPDCARMRAIASRGAGEQRAGGGRVA